MDSCSDLPFLMPGLGTHLASWLQEVDNVEVHEALEWLGKERSNRTTDALAALKAQHGKQAGHSSPIIDAATSGELLATKDTKCMRLWRIRGGVLLRVVSACPGNRVAFSPSGQNIVTGTTDSKIKPCVKIWGPAGGSAVGCGKVKITASKA